MPRVCIIKSGKPEVNRAFEYIEFEPREVETVVIKPSLCCKKHSSTGATVELGYLEQIFRLYEGLAEEIYVVESNSTYYNADDIASYLGLKDLVEYYNAKWVNLSRDVFIPVEKDFSVLEKGFPVPKTILKADVFINLGKMRTDKHTVVNLSLANLFTLIPQARERFYPVVSDAIIDLLMIRAPDINLIDGIVSMEGEAPEAGRPKRMDLTLASRDPVAMDTISCNIMGINPVHVEHILKAGYYGFGEYIEKKIEIVGKRVEDVRDKFLMP